MTELIDRQRTLNVCKECIWIDDENFIDGYNTAINDIRKAIKELPTVLPESRHGRWIVRGQDIYCSECNKEGLYNPFGASKFSHFCPNCGARMYGGADNEHQVR